MPLTVFSLNCRGLNNNLKRSYIFNLCKAYSIACLQETYLTKDNISKWKCEWPGHFFYSVGSSNSKGMLILFNKNIKLDQPPVLLLYSDRILSVEFTLDSTTYHLSNIYAPHTLLEKKTFYEKLNNFLVTINHSSALICGDFNTALIPGIDTISGKAHNSQEIKLFQNLIDDFELADTWRERNGQLRDFTWCRGNIARRLDYILCSNSLLHNISNVKHIIVSCSDHKAVTAEIEAVKIKRGSSSWHLNESLLKDALYVDIINNIIDYCIVQYQDRSPQMLWELLKAEIKSYTIQYSTKKNKNFKIKSNNTKLELDRISLLLIQEPDRLDLQNRFVKLKQEQEVVDLHLARGAQLRSRVKFIEEGEKNSKYFLNLEKSRGTSKDIIELETSTKKINDPIAVLEEIKNYYALLFSRDNNVDGSIQNVLSFLGDSTYTVLSDDENLSCEGALSLSEIGNALSFLNNDSAAGCDGLTVKFYKMFWNKLKTPLLNCFKSAIEQGELTITQKRGIINLFHKGDSKKDLSNWRPITLLNTDYKIFSKVIALRVQNVLPNIISKSQKGFMKNRNIADLIRNIDDIINFARISGTSGLVASLDFRKAFDSVNKDTILNALNTFNFGNYLTNLVKTLLCNTESCIKNAGMLSEWFACDRGVRQGCCASPYLFLIVAEIMSIKIRSTPTILGITFPSHNNETPKLHQYADDTTLILKSELALEAALNLIDRFGLVSGLKLNRKKSTILPIGGFQRDYISNSDVKWLGFGEPIKIVGIYFDSDTEASNLELNWKPKINNMIKSINSWKGRHISMYGKIILCKTFLLSKFNYILQALSLKSTVLDEIDTILFKYVWQKNFSSKKAFEKIKRSVLCKNISEGGLNMISIKDQQKVFHIKWLKKITSELNDFDTAHLFFKGLGGAQYLLACTEEKTHTFLDENIQSKFWIDVLKTWFTLKPKSEVSTLSEILSQPIFLNSNIKYKERPLFIKKFVDKKIKFVKDIVTNSGRIEIENIQQKSGKYPNLMLDFNAIFNGIPKLWKNILIHTTPNEMAEAKNIIIKKPTFIADFLEMKNKNLRNYISNIKDSTICSKSLWKRKFNIDIANYFDIANRTTNESRLRLLHFKIIHNIYPTNILLAKMKIKNNIQCDFCGENDYIEHFFVDCKKVAPFWKFIMNKILSDKNTQISLKSEHILFGIKKADFPQLENNIINYANKLILIGKMCISKLRYGKVNNIFTIFEYEWRLRNMCEEFTCINT